MWNRAAAVTTIAFLLAGCIAEGPHIQKKILWIDAIQEKTREQDVSFSSAYPEGPERRIYAIKFLAEKRHHPWLGIDLPAAAVTYSSGGHSQDFDLFLDDGIPVAHDNAIPDAKESLVVLSPDRIGLAEIEMLMLPRILLSAEAQTILPQTVPTNEWAESLQTAFVDGYVSLFWPSRAYPEWELELQLDASLWPTKIQSRPACGDDHCPQGPIPKAEWLRTALGESPVPSIAGPASVPKDHWIRKDHPRIPGYPHPNIEPSDSSVSLLQAIQDAANKSTSIRSFLDGSKSAWFVSRAEFIGDSSTGRTKWMVALAHETVRISFAYDAPRGQLDLTTGLASIGDVQTGESNEQITGSEDEIRIPTIRSVRAPHHPCNEAPANARISEIVFSLGEVSEFANNARESLRTTSFSITFGATANCPHDVARILFGQTLGQPLMLLWWQTP